MSLKYLVDFALLLLCNLTELSFILKPENYFSWEYKSGYKGFVLLDLHNNTIFISRNVIFHEHILPYTPSQPSSTSSWTYFPSSPSSDIPSPIISPPFIDDDIHSSLPTPSPPIVPIRTSSRNKQTPTYLQDFVCNVSTPSLHSYPISNYLSHNNLSQSHSSFALSILHHIEPKTYAEASKHEFWRQAMQDELSALEKTGTWKIVELSAQVKPIGCRLVA